MTCSFHCSIIQCIFIALKVIYAPPVHPPFLNLWRYLIIIFPLPLLFPEWHVIRNHIVCSLFRWLLLPSNMHFSSMSFHGMLAQFFFISGVIFHCVDAPQFIHSFIHSSFEGFLGFFQVLEIMTKTPLYICLQIFV